VYLFDIDGTLLDSAYDICGAIQQVLDPLGVSPGFEFLRKYIGRHLLDTFQDALPGASPEQIDELIQNYRQVYPARQHKLTKVYPGVPEALASLGGLKSTATTKGSPTSRNILEQFGLLPYFTHVQGTDGFPHKPAPDVLFAALRAMNVGPEDCLFIGDASSDMEAGKRAGVKTCAVTYGYGNHEEMRTFAPDYWIDDLRELLGEGTAAATPGASAKSRAI